MQNPNYPFITPSSTCLSEDLLFFDTFSHSGTEKDNFDLVQFPSPVVIDLIKIVPLGQPIEAKIPGNVRLGATNPSNCELEFFINDLSKQDAHTMMDLGKFYCNEKETDFNPPSQIQTDGLLLRGSYRTLTLAIFGQIATYEEKVEDEQVILSAASPPAQTPASPVASEQDIPYLVRSVDQEILRRARDESQSFDGSTLKSGDLLKEDSLIDNIDMIEEPTLDMVAHQGNLNDQEIISEMSSNDAGGPSMVGRDRKIADTFDYSNNSADMDVYSRQAIAKDGIKEKQSFDHLAINNNNNDDTQEIDHIDEETKEWSFDASSYRPKSLIYFADPSLTLQERSISQLSARSALTSECEMEKLKEMFDSVDFGHGSKTDDWVTLVEDCTNDIANMSLTHIISNDEMLKFLVTQVCHGLDFDLALRQKQTGFRVRHLRAGIKLATILFQCGTQAISALLEAYVPQKVLLLYDRDQMSLPLRLLIFKCLNTICDTVEGVEHIVGHKYNWDETSFSLHKVRKQILEKDLAKKAENGKSPQKEDGSNPCQTEIGEDVNFAQLRKPSPDKHAIADDVCENKDLTCYQYIILILLSQPSTRLTITIGNLIKKIRLYQNLTRLAATSNDEQEESEDSVFASDKPNADTIIQTLQDIVQLLKSRAVNIAQPVRFLPARVQFQVKPNSNDTYLAIYKWLKHHRILEYLTALLSSHTVIEQSVKVQNLSLLFVQQLLDSPRGTQLFLSRDLCDTTCSLLRTLMEKQPAKRPIRLSEGIDNYMNASVLRDESASIARHHDMGLRLTYSFKVFSCIDKLFYFHREVMSKRLESSTSNPEKILHQLYIMSEHPYGLSALSSHLSSIGNLDCLLRFLDMPDHSKQLEFVKETSIDYTLELVGTFFRLNNNVLEIADEYLDTLIELCKTKDKTLSARIKSLLHWLTPFDTERPVPLINYSDESFRQLVRVIRKSIPNYSIPFAKGLDFELPPQMITAVRILRQLCIPPQVESFIETNFDLFSLQKLNADECKSSSFMAFVDSLPHQQNQNQSWNLNLQLSRHIPIENPYEDSISEQLNQISNTFKLFQPYDENICGDLKYHYGIMQLYEQEGLKRLLNTLRELTGNYPRPVYQSAALSGFRGRIVISYIHSVIILVHAIVCHLIDARGSEFKDNSVIPAVLETYSLLCFVPKPQESKSEPNPAISTNHTLTYLQKSSTLRNDNYQLAQQTKKLILSILMSYTQMCLSVSESEEKVISKSMWTKMLREVIDFTLSTPVFFNHGLDVLTKILPSPLPCSSVMDSIDQEQLFKNINHRKLWSAHLHPLHPQIEQMISLLSICYQSNIRTLLCYLCNQLCDLSSNAACMVAKTITDTLISCAAKLTLDTNGASPEHIHADDRLSTANVLAGAKESAYAVKMILNLLSNLITNQAFETAFTNHLQVIGKKDEKLLANLQSTLKFHEDYRPGELVDETMGAGSTNNCLTSVVHFIDSIKAMNDSATKDGFPIIEVEPPEELTKINLVDLARKTTDRISLSSSLWTTYRLKVLMDLNSHAHRATESSKRFEHAPPYNYQEISVPPSHKAYAAPIRGGRGRPSIRPDSFRSRPQNTSRPPSIHVDDFNDLYGDSAGRYAGGVAKSEYRSRRLKPMR